MFSATHSTSSNTTQWYKRTEAYRIIPYCFIMFYCRALKRFRISNHWHPSFSETPPAGPLGEARRAMAATVDAITGTVDETALLAANSQGCERM